MLICSRRLLHTEKLRQTAAVNREIAADGRCAQGIYGRQLRAEALTIELDGMHTPESRSG